MTNCIPSKTRRLIDFYESAREAVLDSGFECERTWQENIVGQSFTESDFLREMAWVILCSGFKVSLIEKIFGSYSLAFCDWESSISITTFPEECFSLALDSFPNKQKASAILDMAFKVHAQGFETVRSETMRNPLQYLRSYRQIGPVTAKHVAKNLGISMAKDDRHLSRLAQMFEFDDVQALCAELSGQFNESIALIDVTLWRYSALNANQGSRKGSRKGHFVRT